VIDDTMPRVSVCSRPSGLPSASTSSPTRTWLESPSFATASAAPLGGATRISARSKIGSAPTSSAASAVPSSSVTRSTWRP
jgi:hypothetical protein